MKSYEKELLEVWKEIENQSFITIKDIEKIKETIGDVFLKIKAQREELEHSRNKWKEKAQEVKEK